MVVLLAAEGLALSKLFDPTPFVDDDRWWAILLAAGPRWFGRLVIATTVATLLIGGARLREALRREPVQSRQSFSWPLLLVHLATFTNFAVLTAVISTEEFKASSLAVGWIAAWAALGAATLGSWAAAAIPRHFWGPRARDGWAVLLAGTAAGIAATSVSYAAQAIWSAQGLWAPLQQATLRAVYALLWLAGSDPVCRPREAVVGTPNFAVSIAPACSGYEGMGLILVFLGVYLAAARRDYRFPRALLLLPLGAVAMWLANVVRITLLIAIGTWGAPEVADGGFHSQAGWLAFNGIALGLVAGSRRQRFFTRPELRADGVASTNPTAAYLVPLLAIIATTMITGAFSSGFDRFYPLRVLAATGALWYFRRDYVGWRWTWSWPAVAIGVGTFVLWMALEPAPSDLAAETMLTSGLAHLPAGWAATWLAFRVVGSVVTVPLAEELAFRGYLTRRLIASDFQDVPLGRFTWLSFLVSSALFGALHGRWLAGILAGMLYALALYRRGELTDAIVAHATTNALIAGYVLATGTWSLWV